MADRKGRVPDAAVGAGAGAGAGALNALQPVTVLSFWTQCIQQRWSRWDDARGQAVRASINAR